MTRGEWEAYAASVRGRRVVPMEMFLDLLEEYRQTLLSETQIADERDELRDRLYLLEKYPEERDT